jgi:hypothetical protein
MHESSAYELIMEEGAIKASHRHLLLQGKQRLGSPSEGDIAALKAIKDLDRLDRLTVAVLNVSSWQELLATP